MKIKKIIVEAHRKVYIKKLFLWTWFHDSANVVTPTASIAISPAHSGSHPNCPKIITASNGPMITPNKWLTAFILLIRIILAPYYSLEIDCINSPDRMQWLDVAIYVAAMPAFQLAVWALEPRRFSTLVSLVPVQAPNVLVWFVASSTDKDDLGWVVTRWPRPSRLKWFLVWKQFQWIVLVDWSQYTGIGMNAIEETNNERR